MLTIRKKRPEAEATPADATPDAPPGLTTEPSAAEPEAVAAAGGVSAKRYTVFAILGLVATFCIIALLVMQFIEFSSYKADPSVWPVK